MVEVKFVQFHPVIPDNLYLQSSRDNGRQRTECRIDNIVYNESHFQNHTKNPVSLHRSTHFFTSPLFKPGGESLIALATAPVSLVSNTIGTFLVEEDAQRFRKKPTSLTVGFFSKSCSDFDNLSTHSLGSTLSNVTPASSNPSRSSAQDTEWSGLTIWYTPTRVGEAMTISDILRPALSTGNH